MKCYRYHWSGLIIHTVWGLYVPMSVWIHMLPQSSFYTSYYSFQKLSQFQSNFLYLSHYIIYKLILYYHDRNNFIINHTELIVELQWFVLSRLQNFSNLYNLIFKSVRNHNENFSIHILLVIWYSFPLWSILRMTWISKNCKFV